MDIIYHPIFLEHDTGMHPESRKRFDCFPKLDASDFPSGEGFLTLVHTSEYIQKVKEACAAGMPLDHDTMTSKKSYAAACMAVGATIAASERGGLAMRGRGCLSLILTAILETGLKNSSMLLMQ